MAAQTLPILGFRSNFSHLHTIFSPKIRTKSPKPFESDRRNKPPRIHLSSSSAVDEQQIFFTEPENILLEALVGIQGRGRAASPQQLMDIESAVKILEDLKGVPDPVSL